MDAPPDDLIARELSKLHGAGARAPAAALDGHAFSMDIEVPKPPDKALARCIEALSDLGTLRTEPHECDAAPDGLTHPTVVGMTGEGLRTVKPALVACSIVAVGDRSTTVRLFAVSPTRFRRKQNAEGAVRRVATLVLEED